MAIIREPNLTAEEHAMLDQFERDLNNFLEQFAPQQDDDADELFWEFDEDAEKEEQG